MTYEKALNYFKSRVDGKGIDNIALCFALMAIEKQISKDVIGTGLIRLCPNCRQKFFVDDDKSAMQCYACPRCGQKLKFAFQKGVMPNVKEERSFQKNQGRDYRDLSDYGVESAV